MGNSLKKFEISNFQIKDFKQYNLSTNIIDELYFKKFNSNSNKLFSPIIDIKKIPKEDYTFDLLTIRKILPKTYNGIKKMLNSGFGYLLKINNKKFQKIDSELFLYPIIYKLETKYTCDDLDKFNSEGYIFEFLWNNDNCEILNIFKKELIEYNLEIKKEFENQQNQILENIKKLNKSLLNVKFEEENNEIEPNKQIQSFENQKTTLENDKILLIENSSEFDYENV